LGRSQEFYLFIYCIYLINRAKDSQISDMSQHLLLVTQKFKQATSNVNNEDKNIQRIFHDE